MGSDTILGRTNGQTIDEDWFNVLSRVLSGDILPRTAGVVPNAGAGIGATNSLGDASNYFDNLYVNRVNAYVGGPACGDLKMFLITGFLVPGEGWMLCDGRVVSQANYDAEHGAGAWAANIGSSPIDGRYLPDFLGGNGRYPVGAPSTPVGAVPIASVGNTNSFTNLGSQNVRNDVASVAVPTAVGSISTQPDSIGVVYYMRII